MFGSLTGIYSVQQLCMKRKCDSACSNRLRYHRASWLPGLLVAILPKCPFCIMAYSGAFTLCSGTTMYPNAGGLSAYIALGLAVLVLISILVNYKGKKTLVALTLSAVAILLIISSQFYFISSIQYYIGTCLLLFGIWYNGSFSHFYKKYKGRLSQPVYYITKNNLNE